METLLIDRSDLIEICDNFSDNAREDKVVNPQILNAQRFDISPAIGAALYYDLTENFTDANYVALLEGGPFTNCQGDTVLFYGLRYALAWFTYARILGRSSAHISRAGGRFKQSDKGQQIPKEETSTLTAAAGAQANAYLTEAIEFLNAKKDEYPLWDDCKAVESKNRFMYNISRRQPQR